MGRIFVVGDIHGCLDKAEELLSRLPINWDNDTLVFLGDYVDRGPDPAGVVRLMIELKENHPDRVVCLKGNHEVMFLDYLKDDKLAGAFLNFGGTTTLESYKISPDEPGPRIHLIPASHMRFLESLPLYYETSQYFMVHAGVKPGVPLKDQKEEDMLWIRDKFIKSDFDWGKRIVFGHTAFEAPLMSSNKIGIDTGAVYGGRLTCLVLPEIDFIMV